MTNGSVSDRFMAWMKKPYSDDMSVKGWFLFLGLIGVLSWLWGRVLITIAKSI